jgi:hypothetical protein
MTIPDSIEDAEIKVSSIKNCGIVESNKAQISLPAVDFSLNFNEVPKQKKRNWNLEMMKISCKSINKKKLKE